MTVTTILTAHTLKTTAYPVRRLVKKTLQIHTFAGPPFG